MGLSTQDFVVAFRALSSRACPPAAVRKALRAQASRMEKGRRLTLVESLVATGALPSAAAGELASEAPVDFRSDPEALTTAGELFLATESASEVELDRIVDSFSRPADPRTLKETPVPLAFTGYDVSWEIGRSRTGSVYRGSKRGTGGAVAIKVFRPEAFDSEASRRAFLERAASASVDDSPDYKRVLEAREVDGHAIVVREFLEGAPLEQLLSDRKVSLRRGFEIAGRAAAAVGATHGRGAAHGRLSTRAVFVQANDHPKLDRPDPPPGATIADDVAALGAVLYEIAAGVPPYGGFRSHELKPPSRHNPSCAGAAERIILKALARDPARRYPAAGALAEDIGRFLRHEEVTADVDISEAAPPSRPVIAAKRRSWAWKVAVAAAAAMILVTVLAVMSGRGKEPPPAPPPPSAAVPPAPPALPAPPPRAPSPPPPPKVDARVRDWASKGPLSPNEEIDFQFRASGFMTKRAFDDLDRLAEEALVRGPETSWAHYYRGFVALERGDDEAALKHADRALALGLNRTTLYELRLDIRLSRAEYRMALDELARLFPKDSVSAANQEIQRLNRDLEREPTHGPTLIRRGALFLHRKLSGRAAEDFAKAVAAGESRAEYFLALALKEQDKVAEAAEAVRRFLAAHGSAPGAVEAKSFLDALPN